MIVPPCSRVATTRRSLLAALAAVSVIALGPGAAAADDSSDVSVQVSPEQPHAAQPMTLTIAAPSKGGDGGDDGDDDGHEGDGGRRVVQAVWDLDDDGTFDDAAGTAVQTAFATAGEHEVRVRVTFDHGDPSTASREVEVGPPPPAAPPPAAAPRAHLLSPFPVVRIRGWVLGRGSRVRVLSVRAQRGSVVRVRCRGRGCPVTRIRAHVSSGRRPLRIHAFERHLRAGVMLQVVVTKPHRIGKYTRFLIRGGAAPARRDSCAGPVSHRPFRCPGG